MDQQTEKRLEIGWRTLTLIGVIMGAGFAGATYLSRYQTTDMARDEHAEMTKATEAVGAQASDLQSEVQNIQMTNVRIEISQQQISDQLKLIALQGKPRVNREDRAQIRELEAKTEKRGAALRQSYEQKPVIKSQKSLPDDDPLAGLEGL